MEKSQISQPKQDIDIIRKKLDEIDEKIVELIIERFSHIPEISAYKQEHNLPIQNKEREREVLETKAALVKNKEIPKEMIEQLFEIIMLYSRKEQEKLQEH